MTSSDPKSTTPSEKAHTPGHISLNEQDVEGHEGSDSITASPRSRSSSGWDGKLRVDKLDKKLELVNPEAISDPEYSDDENVLPGETIAADEGTFSSVAGSSSQQSN